MWDQCGYQEWVNLTQKLRKYAQKSTAKDIIVMDEAAAIYFRFVDPTEDVNYPVEFFFVDTTCEGTTRDSPFSMRELVAFVCWTALVKKGVTFPIFTNDRNMEAVLSCYRSILRPLLNNPQSGRPILAREQTEPKFAGWTVGLSFELGPVPHHAELSGPPDLDVQIPSTSPDSGGDDLSSSPYHSHHCKARDFHKPPSGRATYTVESVFTNHVAELSCQQLPGRWIVKFFGADTGAPRTRNLHLQPLQAAPGPPDPLCVWHRSYRFSSWESPTPGENQSWNHHFVHPGHPSGRRRDRNPSADFDGERQGCS